MWFLCYAAKKFEFNLDTMEAKESAIGADGSVVPLYADEETLATASLPSNTTSWYSGPLHFERWVFSLSEAAERCWWARTRGIRNAVAVGSFVVTLFSFVLPLLLMRTTSFAESHDLCYAERLVGSARGGETCHCASEWEYDWTDEIKNEDSMSCTNHYCPESSCHNNSTLGWCLVSNPGCMTDLGKWNNSDPFSYCTPDGGTHIPDAVDSIYSNVYLLPVHMYNVVSTFVSFLCFLSWLYHSPHTVSDEGSVLDKKCMLYA